MNDQACLIVVVVAAALSARPAAGLNSYISIGRCDEWEQEEFERKHLDCTRQVEERYSLILERFDVDLPSPHGSARNKTRPPFVKQQSLEELCNMLDDSITKCGRIYQHCLTEDEYRQFLDGQIEIFVQLLTTLYSLGPEVSQCEIVQEYERSGRKDIVRPTDKCKEKEIKKLTIRYQQCIEDANYDMSRAMIGHHANFNLAFEALCLGIDRVVHICSDVLFDCYTVEEIEETKLGQLEIMRKVFLDLVEETAPDLTNHTEGLHWDFDLRKCHAYYLANSATAFEARSGHFALALVFVAAYI